MQLLSNWRNNILDNFFNTLAGKKVAFIGIGVSHRELIPLFAKAGALVTLCDQKGLDDLGPIADTLMGLGVHLSLGSNYLDGLDNQDMILRTPGFEFYTPELQSAAKKGAIVTSETELFMENCPCPIVGVTGSDGKTTTTSLIAAMYEQAGQTVHLGGNIGRPLLPILNTVKETDVAVMELSSFQLISMRTSPHIAVVTNVTPNHLDHHKDMQEYIDAKRNILLYQNEEDIAVLGFENEITRDMEDDVKGECRWFSRLNEVDDGAYLSDDDILTLAEYDVRIPVVSRSKVSLKGLHNVENILAALAVVKDEVPLECMQKVATDFAGVEHRIEYVRTKNGVTWYNDSIATSPTRVIAGLRSFNQKLIVIAGGYDKNIPFEPMAPDVIKSVKILILMGPAAPKIEQAIKEDENFEQSELKILHAENLEQAVQLAQEYAVEDDIVTLSPACASFDAYTNFEERGKAYKELVKNL